MGATYEKAKRVFEFYEECAEKKKLAIAQIEKLLDEYLVSKDKTFIDKIPWHDEKNYWLNGAKYYRYGNIKIICSLEEKHGIKDLFLENCADHTDVLDKYIKTILYMRRLELDVEDSAKEEALLFLINEGISIYAVHVILEKELFEKKDLLFTFLGEYLSGGKVNE